MPKGYQSKRLEIVAATITIQSEWGLFEMTGGDWQCGVQNFDDAIARLQIIQPMINDQDNMMSFLVARRQSGSPKLGQPQAGC